MGGGDGTDPNSVSAAETRAMEAELQAGIKDLQARTLARGKRHHHHHVHLPKFVKINTYVHVITATDGTGDVTNKQIRDQIKVLNDGFAGRTSATAARTPFHFKLTGVDRTANDDWYDWGYPATMRPRPATPTTRRPRPHCTRAGGPT